MVKFFATLPILYAGFVHLYISGTHIEHAPAHGYFFVFLGIIQIVWAALFLWNRSKILYYLGLAISGGIIVLWAITRVLPAPFEGVVGPIDYWSVFAAFCEAVGFIGLLIYAKQGGIPHFQPKNIFPLVGKALLIGSLTGAFLFFAGNVTESLFPEFQAEQGEIHEEGEFLEH